MSGWGNFSYTIESVTELFIVLDRDLIILSSTSNLDSGNIEVGTLFSRYNGGDENVKTEYSVGN
jgi:hypothetical protein